MKRASCGLDVNSPIEICSTLKLASDQGFEFVSLPLAHPRFKREFTEEWKNRSGPFTRPDLVLRSSEWNSLIAGKISPYLNLDSLLLNGQDKFALEQELNYGSHLDVPAVIIPLRSSRCFNLARIINSNLAGLKAYQIWLEVPLVSYERSASLWRSDLNEEELQESTWEWWNRFYTFCNSDKRLGVILEITKNIPDEKELQRWRGEPIKCLSISTSTFLTNKKGYPVLSRPIQSFVKSLVPIDIQVIIKGNNHHNSLDCYQKYIDHLWQEASVQQNSKLEDISVEKNSIEDPFHPFDCNMSRPCEISEKNLHKYTQYTKAIHQAILDKAENGDESTNVLNLMVVCAGKSFLLPAAFKAVEKSQQKVKIYAVERNPHALVSLQVYKEETRKDVELIDEDVRLLNFPRMIDIIVTDSLGSFGDNELSPEITDGAQKFLKSGGISIPQSYTSYICPVQGSKVYSDLKSSKNYSDCEIPYVIMQKQSHYISPMKSLFSFRHPNHSEHIDNSRYENLTFEIEQNCVLHGFAGFFDVVLYKDVKLSFLPDSVGLECNWNPIFFPLLEPVHLKMGDRLDVHFWRIVDATKVWYEWTITKPIPLPLHNPNGRSSHIPL